MSPAPSVPDARAEWVRRVLGFDVAAAAEQAAGLRGLLRSVSEDLALLRARDPARARPIEIVEARAKALARRNPQAAMALLDGAGLALAQAAREHRAEAAKASVARGHVARMAGLLQQARAGWDAGLAEAQRCAAAHIAEVAKRYPAQAAGFATILASYRADLGSLLTAAQGAARDGDGAVEIGPIQRMVAALSNEVAADRLLVHLTRHHVPVQAALLAALQRVQDLLPSGQVQRA